MKIIRTSSSFEASYGGSEANIALALANLGVSSTFFSVMPDNSIGKGAVRMLRSNDVHCSPIILSTPEETPTHRMGCYFLETGFGIRPSKVTYDRKHSAFSEYDYSRIDLRALLKDCTWLHLSGITPALSANCRALVLHRLKAAKDLGLTVSFDGNFRSALWSWEEARDVCTEYLPYAVAITVSMLRGDYNTAGSIMFLLKIGDILDEWTHKKSVDDLARTMSLGVEQVWMLTSDGQELLVPVSQIQKGDCVIVRTGSMIPLDGKVIAGDAMVNQASMTGESVPVHKSEGTYVYAGTVVEDGVCTVQAENTAGSGRYDRIVKMIEESEQMKSSAESRAAHLADQLVPWCLGGTLLTLLLTRNATKAVSILMVDFSCALKLAMPISVLSAMRQCTEAGITVKGGKFLEAVAEADTIVFDKTGTLTHSQPRVAQIIPFGGRDEAEMIRLAACLEEHYPHSIANAVVAEAERRGLLHEERHSEVEYVVAHGISSMIEGERVVISSYHFVVEDEACKVPDERIFRHLPKEYSHLYLAIGGEIAAVICIEDPLRDEAGAVIQALHELGISNIVMMTGDNERTAKSVAEKVGVDTYYSEVLPEDKAAFILAEHEAGRRVIMIGDGVNDSPALSESDAGIAISTGAAIAREIADITISANDLCALIDLKRLSDALMPRIHRNYRTIIGFNLGLILLGAAGILPPATSALLHNASTLAIGLKSMTNLPASELSCG